MSDDRRPASGTMQPPADIPEITGDAEVDHLLYLLASLAWEIEETSRSEAA